MTKTYCDKCKKEHHSISKIIGQKAIYEVKEDKVGCVVAEIDLCDECRRELGGIIADWIK